MVAVTEDLKDALHGCERRLCDLGEFGISDELLALADGDAIVLTVR